MKAPSGPYADKLWREALRKAVLERVEGEQKLDVIARRVVRQAMDPDPIVQGSQALALSAAKEIGDRLDGKPAQAVIGGDENDPPIRTITEIRRVIVDPKEPA
jgi:hypothetical protein